MSATWRTQWLVLVVDGKVCSELNQATLWPSLYSMASLSRIVARVALELPVTKVA